VYGIASSTSVGINQIRFDIGLTAGGSPVDMEKTVLTYSKGESSAPAYLDFGTGWTVTPHGGDTDDLLERGELFTILVTVPTDGKLKANDRIRLEVRPPVGAVLGLDRTAPPQIDKVNELF